MSVTPPRAAPTSQPPQPPTTSSLVEVVAALIPLIDQFPHLQWRGSITGDDFVELWFPFIADYVQNGVYDPPPYIRSIGGMFCGGATSPTAGRISPPRQQRNSPSLQQQRGAGSLWRGVSPSRVVQRGGRSSPELSSRNGSPLGARVASPPLDGNCSGAKAPVVLSSFLHVAAFAATRERASSLTTSPTTKQLLGSRGGGGRGDLTSGSGARVGTAPLDADANTVASVIVLRSFVSVTTSLVLYQLKLLDFDLEHIVSNSGAKRRESLVPSMLPSYLSTGAANPSATRRGSGSSSKFTITSPSARTLITPPVAASNHLPLSPDRSPEAPSRRAGGAMDRSANVISFALGSAHELLESFNHDEDDSQVLQPGKVAQTSSPSRGQATLASRLFSQLLEDDDGETSLNNVKSKPQRKGTNVHFSEAVSDGSGLSGGDSNPFSRRGTSTSSRGPAAGNSGGGGGGSPPDLEFLNAKDSIQGESRSRLIREIQRIWSTPKGRRPGFAKEYFQSFPELKVFVETLLSSLYSCAAEPSDADRITWLEFQGFLTDSAIAYNTQLSLRDVPIFVEEATATVSGSVTFIGTVLCDPTFRVGVSSSAPSSTPQRGPAKLPVAGAAPPSMLSRMVLTVQQGVSNPSLLVMPPGIVHPSNPRTTKISSPSVTIKAIEYLENIMCFVCCSDRAVHFYDFRYGPNNGSEIASFSLDALSDSPACLIWLPDHNMIVVGGISGYIWKITPPSWSAAKREWRLPVLHHCVPNASSSSSSEAAAAGDTALEAQTPRQQQQPTNATGSNSVGGAPVFSDSVHILRRAFHPSLLFVACRSSIALFDVVRDVVKLSHHAHADGIHHIAGLVFNQATQYLLCTGETLHILVWLSPNLPRQSAVKMFDMIAPHSGHIIGLESHPTAPIVVSMDFHGAVKIWDLDSMACSQNIFLQMPRVVDVNRLHLRFYGKCICTVIQNKITLFKVDEETVESAPSAVLAHPKGGSFVFPVNRDLVQLSSAEGKKEIHHQNIADVETIQACFAGSSTVVLLSSLGAVTVHSISSGKLISSFGRKQLKAEGVDLVYCSEFRRVVVPTAASIIWFLPTEFTSTVEPPPAHTSSSGGGGSSNSPQETSPRHNHLHHPNSPMLLKKAAVDAAMNSKKPFHLFLDAQDSAASCVALGRHEKQIVYCVGTVENSVNIFALSTTLPRTVKLVHRIPAPPSTTPLASSTIVASSEDESSGAGGSLEPDVVTSIILSLRSLVVCDSAGILRTYRPGSWTYLMKCHLWELVLSSGRDISCITHDERAEHYALSTEHDVAPKVLCSSHYKLDSVIAIGDSLGRILFIDVTRSASMTLLHWWQVYTDGGGVNRLAVEKETIATVGDSAALYVWTSGGEYLGNVWGRRASSAITVPDQILPEWLDPDLLIGEGSVLLRRQSTRQNRLGGSLVRVARAVSVVERVSRLSKLRLVGFDQMANSNSVSILAASSQLPHAASSTPSASVSRSLNFGDDGSAGSSPSVLRAASPQQRRGEAHKSQLFDQLPSVSFAQSLASGGNFGDDVEFQTSYDASRRSSVSVTNNYIPTSQPTVLTARSPDTLGVPMPTKPELLEVITPRADDDEDDEHNDGVGIAHPFLFKVETSSMPFAAVHHVATGVAPISLASPASRGGGSAGGGDPAALSSTTSSSQRQDQSTSQMATHLRPIAWKASDVTALDNAFREALGQQRILGFASQLLGQPNTMRRVMIPRDLSPTTAIIGHQDSKKPRKSMAASVATSISDSKPRLTITMQRSGNIVSDPQQRRRSQSSLT